MIAVAATATNWTDAVSAVAAAAAALTGLLALGAVVVGSLYARGQLRAAREQRDEAKASRYAELVVGLSNQWREKELADARKLEVSFGDQAGLRRAIEEKYPTQDADYVALERIPVFFENPASSRSTKPSRSISCKTCSGRFSRTSTNDGSPRSTGCEISPEKRPCSGISHASETGGGVLASSELVDRHLAGPGELLERAEASRRRRCARRAMPRQPPVAEERAVDGDVAHAEPA